MRRVIVREFRINRSVNLNSDIEKYGRPSISDKVESARHPLTREIRERGRSVDEKTRNRL